jgi:RNA recognition motif-containing protein
MNNRLYVGNLSFQTSEEALQEAFSQFGEVTEVKLILDRDTGRSRGFAFVVMGTPEAAQQAIQEMNGAELDGRPLRVNEAEARRERPGGGFGGGGGRSRSGGDRGGYGGGGGGGGGRGRRNDRNGGRW